MANTLHRAINSIALIKNQIFLQYMSHKVAILQSNYIPWKGYFDIINLADIFIIYDQAQYTKNDWRNRNLIKTPQGSQWLTIPVKRTSLKAQRICDTEVANAVWRKKHWHSLLNNYRKAPYFSQLEPSFRCLYLDNTHIINLSQINLQFITVINQILGITTEIRYASEFTLASGKTERLVDLCKQNHASHYISGASAQSYLDLERFKQENIKLHWMDYSQYPEYSQLYPPFIHSVSILDLLFNHGSNAYKYMCSFT